MVRLLVAIVLAAAAYPQPRQAVTPEVSTANIPANLPAQRVGPNDLVAVSVYDAAEFSRTVRIGPDGTIRFPMMKRTIQAAGRLPAEIESAIAAALIAENLIVDPFVTVTVVEYHSRPISVAGAVRKPLTFQAVGGISLLDAIARAEGLSPEAGAEILISRPQRQVSRNGTDRANAEQVPGFIQRIPVKGLIDRADPELNVELTGGEEIRVPEMGKVFVVGNVRRPGSYRMSDDTETTVLKVLALSEGLLPYAGKMAFIYRREGGEGAKNEIPIELKKIMERKSPDVPLAQNDVLYVPDNTGKRAAFSVLERMLLFGTTAGATAVAIRR
jgi:polysaccharide export outer membrane protein